MSDIYIILDSRNTKRIYFEPKGNTDILFYIMNQKSDNNIEIAMLEVNVSPLDQLIVLTKMMITGLKFGIGVFLINSLLVKLYQRVEIW